MGAAQPGLRVAVRVDEERRATPRKGAPPHRVTTCTADGGSEAVRVEVDLPPDVVLADVDVDLTPTSLRVACPPKNGCPNGPICLRP